MIFTLPIEKMNQSTHPTIFIFIFFSDNSLMIKFWVLINTHIC